MTIKNITLLLFAFMGLLSMNRCNKDSNDHLLGHNNSESVVTFSMLNGNHFVLEVDRIADHPNVQSPFDELDENDYASIDNGNQYFVSFSDDIQTITLLPDSVSGLMEKDTNVLKQYNLDDGLFAGGRFVVWIDDDGFEAEYTIYGSGVPIIQSERGGLTLSD